MIVPRRHVTQARLIDHRAAARAGVAPDLWTARHLDRCDACAARYAKLSQLLDESRLEADAETEAILTSERLRSQRQQIMARLEHLGQAARVISFPVRTGRRSIRPAQPLLTRWAAAVAAGVFLGIGLQFAYESAWTRPRVDANEVRATPSAPPVEPPLAADPDAFFSDLDAALEGPRNPDLMLFDALTPRVSTIGMQVR